MIVLLPLSDNIWKIPFEKRLTRVLLTKKGITQSEVSLSRTPGLEYTVLK